MSTPSDEAKRAAGNPLYSPEAKKAAEEKGICGQALLPFCIGYDTATAKLKNKKNKHCDCFVSNADRSK